MKKILFSLLSIGLFSLFQLNAQVSSFPYEENFDSFSECAPLCDRACDLTAGWTNDTTDFTDWIVTLGETNSFGTGPTVDHTTGTDDGQYLYLEAGSACLGSVGNLISPSFDLNTLPNAAISFWYHMFAGNNTGFEMGNLFVDVSNDSGATWIQIDSIRDTIDLWQRRELDISAYLGDTVQVRLRGLIGSGTRSDIAIDDFSLFVKADDDAGIASIDLTNPLTTGSPVPVPVTITNFGANPITSATINWSIDGVAQTPFAFTGNIARGASVSIPSVGDFTFTAGQTVTVTASTSLTNGNADGDASNDSSEGLFCSALEGTYTLGVGGDFETFNVLSDILNSCGVSANVTVNVAAGTYDNQALNLDHVTGLSSTSTLTVDGANAATMTSDFNMIALNGTDWTTIQNMTFNNTADDEITIWLADSATGNTIDNCVITMIGDEDAVGISASFAVNQIDNGGSSGGRTNANMTTISNNTITGGGRAIAFTGNVDPIRAQSNSILNNTITATEGTSISMVNQDNLVVNGNHISGQIAGDDADDAISLDDINLMVVSNNIIINAPEKGLDCRDINFNLHAGGTQPGPILAGVTQIYNNMISSIDDHAFDLDDAHNVQIWHNTFSNDGHVAGRFGPIFNAGTLLNDIDNVDFRNNICASNLVQGFVASDAVEGSNNVLDYNLYWTASDTVGFASENRVDYADIASWQAASPSLNANSVLADPLFVSAPFDLHLFSPTVNDLGDNSVGITDDIDGDTRPASGSVNVDIGADEFSPVSTNASIFELIGGQCADSASDINVVIRNIGTDPITSVSINVDVTGNLTQSFSMTYSGSLALGEMDTVTVGSINTYAGLDYDLEGSVTLAGDLDNSNNTLNTSFSVIPFEPVGFDAFFCDGDSTEMLTALDISGVRYEWYDSLVGGSQQGSGTSFELPDTLAQSTYYLQYDDECSTFRTAVSFITSTSATASFESSATFLEVAFDASATANADSIRWDFGDGNTGTGITMSNTYSADGDYNVCLIAYSNCAIDTVCDTIRVCGEIVSNFSSTTSLLDVDFTDLSEGTPATWAWDFGDGSIDSIQSPSHTYSEDGSYDVTLTVTNLCGNDSIFTESITVCDSIVSDFNIATIGTLVNFVDLSTGTPTTWAWDFDDGNTADTQSPLNTYPSVTADYVVSLTVTNLCGETSFSEGTISLVVNGVNEFDLASTVSVSPNPNKGQFVIDLSNYNGDDLEVTVTDQLGKVVYSEFLSANNQNERLAVDLANSSNGLYFLRLSSNLGVVTKKIIIQE